MQLRLFVYILFVAHSAGYAESPLLVGVRDNDEATEAFARKNDMTRAKVETIEFANGNTFVRFKTRIYNRDTFVLLAEEMTSDQLMEALIKVRTARTNGAQNIVVAAPVDLNKIKITDLTGVRSEVNLARMFRVAGANYRVSEDTGKLAYLRAKRLPPALVGATVNAMILDEGHPELSEKIAKSTKLEQVENTGLAGLRSLGKGKYYYLVHGTGEKVNEGLFRSLAKASLLAKKGNRVHLFTPYLPYARSDKVDQKGVTVIGRLVADLIESSGVAGVTYVRSHAPQSQGFFDIHSKELSGRPTINRYLRTLNVQAVISPDNGFQKDAAKYAEELFGANVEKHFGSINKSRNPITEELKIIGYSGANVRGKTVVIVDDETASGKTLAKAAEYLIKKKGAKKVIAVVTHLTGSAQAALDSKYLSEIVVTNTVPVRITHPKLKVLNIHPEFTRLIKKLEKGRKVGLGKNCAGQYQKIHF